MPSDVVWAAIIAGGVGLAGNCATVIATQLQRKGQERVEDARIAAERQRFRDQITEGDRQRRFDSYADFIRALDELHRVAVEPLGDDELFNAARAYRLARDRLRILGSDEARDAVEELHALLWEASIEGKGEGEVETAAARWRARYHERMKKIVTALTEVEQAMRNDVFSGPDHAP